MATRAAAVACALALLAAPAPAAARVTVSVQFAYGGIVVGGVGVFIAFSGYWEAYLAGRGLPTALLEIRGGEVRAGLPLLAPRLAPDAADPEAVDGVQLDLLRLRF